MQLFYTGAATAETPQTNPELSLGGFKSNTVINLTRANALFGDISYLIKVNKTSITRAFVLKNNDATDTAVDVTIGYEYTLNNGYKLEVAFVTLTNNQMEQILSQRDTPYYGEFVEANLSTVNPTFDNSVNVGNMAAGECLGMWMRLTPNADSKSCDTLLAEQTTPPTQTNVVLKVSFTLAAPPPPAPPVGP